MINNKGWNLYMSIPKLYNKYVIDLIRSSDKLFKSFKEAFDITHVILIKIFDYQNQTRVWFWIDSDRDPDIDMIRASFYKLLFEQSNSDRKILTKCLKSLWDKIVEAEPNRVVVGCRLKVNIMVNPLDFIIPRQIIKNNPEFASEFFKSGIISICSRLDNIDKDIGNRYLQYMTDGLSKIFPSLDLNIKK